MIKLKKDIGKLDVGLGQIIKPSTDEKTIKRILKSKPHLKEYFEGFPKKQKDE